MVERKVGASREERAEDALRSLNTRSCSRVRPSGPPLSSRHRPRLRPRPGLGLSPAAMDISYNPSRMSWGAGLLSPLSPNTMETLESRSRDVQERTFCKWYVRPQATRCCLTPVVPQAQHEARSEWLSSDDLSCPRSFRWRTADSAHGECSVLRWLPRNPCSRLGSCRKLWVWYPVLLSVSSNQTPAR